MLAKARAQREATEHHPWLLQTESINFKQHTHEVSQAQVVELKNKEASAAMVHTQLVHEVYIHWLLCNVV